jgi:hypothetical protein
LHVINEQQPSGKQRINDSESDDVRFSVRIGYTIKYTISDTYTNAFTY